ncbi:MAG: hypothetical protein AAB453_03840 [Patescibacteria group bacterium]
MACKYSTWTRGKDEALLNILGGQKIAELIIAGKVKVAIEEIIESLLDFVATVVVLATKSKFVASDNFKLKKDGGICSYLGDNFKAWFLNGDSKTEDPIGEQTLRYAKLRNVSVDGPIITELGGEAKAETTLSEMFSLMEKQKNGESGVLLSNGYANIFYIRDIAGVLRAVGVSWYDGGWHVHAYSVEYPYEWNGGSQVFSRNPSATVSATS